VRFRLGPRALSYWHARRNRWQVVPGCYQFLLGRSSRDIVASDSLGLRASCG
jgi:hypothetical protein